MGRVTVQVCLVSTRGLRSSPSLRKRHWFAIGWIDPKDEYCLRIHCSGNPYPVWNSKFLALVDDSEALTLHVQVYCRDPFFVTERLQGSAAVSLSEFLRKRSNGSRNGEDVGSYQLRKNNSGKPRGFVDVPISVMSEKGNESPLYPGIAHPLSLLTVDAAAGL